MKKINLTGISRKTVQIIRCVLLSLTIILIFIPPCLRLAWGVRKYNKWNRRTRIGSLLCFIGSLCGLMQSLLALYEEKTWESVSRSLLRSVLNGVSLGLSTASVATGLDGLLHGD